MSKTLHVVFYDSEYFKDVAFITYDKRDVDIFFNRPSRQESYFHVEVNDKSRIKLFERDFGHRICEISGTTCMLPHEFEEMLNSIPGLIDGLVDHIKILIDALKYIHLNEFEEKLVLDMLGIYYSLLKSEYECENEDDIFDMELLMDRYLQDIGE